MHYLIDGHNLIAHLPDISLDDPNDEAKLVLRLRSWVAAGRRRHVTVIFDGGLPGGMWRRLSTKRIKAIFASEDSTADALLIRRVEQVQDAGANTLVSSDRAILAAAKSRRMPYITSERFAQSLADHKSSLEDPVENDLMDSKVNLTITDEEVAEWLQLFESEAVERPNPESESWSRPRNSEATRQKATEVSQRRKSAVDRPVTDPAKVKSGDHELDEAELSEWLELFNQPGDKS